MLVRQLKRICAWCLTTLEDGPDVDVTHGLCSPCDEKLATLAPDADGWHARVAAQRNDLHDLFDDIRPLALDPIVERTSH